MSEDPTASPDELSTHHPDVNANDEIAPPPDQLPFGDPDWNADEYVHQMKDYGQALIDDVTQKNKPVLSEGGKLGFRAEPNSTIGEHLGAIPDTDNHPSVDNALPGEGKEIPPDNRDKN